MPTLVLQYADDPIVVPAQGKLVADHISGAKYVELPGRNMFHFVEPWRESFQEIAEFLTGQQPDVADDRVLATVLFTDSIVDSTAARRRSATVTGMRCSTRTTPSFGCSSLGFETARSTHRATASSRCPTARIE